MTSPILQCPTCKYFKDSDSTCPAFPKGVPGNLIYFGKLHDIVLTGQEGGYVYDPINDAMDIRNYMAPRTSDK